MKATDLKQKLYIIYNLFQPVIKHNETPIDSEKIISSNGYGKLTRAYAISHNYLYYNKLPTKSDMIYINKTVSKLISLLGKDISIINRNYIKTKLIMKTTIYTADDWRNWIDNYKQLIEIIK